MPTPWLAGFQNAVFGYNAFGSVNAAIAAASGGRHHHRQLRPVQRSGGRDQSRDADLQQGDSTFNSLDDTVYTATLNLNGVTLISGGDDNTTQFDSLIDGTGGLLKTGGGTLTLSHANTYPGLTTVNAGVLQIGVGQRHRAGNAVTVAGSRPA